MNKDDFIRVYCAQYKILEKQMISLSEYIAIDKSNYSTFSLQLNTLFISICSEIDSLSGEFCKLITGDNGFGIINKIDIIVKKHPNLRNFHIETKYPFSKIDLVPFAKFAPNTDSWWSDYNKVKHDRVGTDENGRFNYQKANLKNVLHSIAALYILISKISEELEIDELPIKSELFNKTIK